MDPHEADEGLVQRFQEGNAGAFEELVDRHSTRVYNLCLRILGDPDEAADASQDTFLSALRKLHTFRGDAAFTTWLHRVTVNACYDSLRRKRRRPMLRIVTDEDDDRPEPSIPSPDHADRVVLSIDVAAALTRIPEEFRIALVMADAEDLRTRRSRACSRSPWAPWKSRVFRGRAALGKALGAWDGEPTRASRASEEEA